MPSRLSLAFPFLASLFLALPAIAQAPPFGETVEVRIVNVDVMVTRDGQYVSGLRPDDFELVVNGKVQPITNFSEVHEAASAVATSATTPASSPMNTPSPSAATDEQAPRRKAIALVIDLYSLENQRRNQALDALRNFAHKNLSKDDVVMLATWNHTMKIPLSLTSDLSRLDAVLNTLSKSSGAGLSRDRQFAQMRIRSTAQEYEVAAAGRGSPATYYGYALGHANSFAEEQTKFASNFSDDCEQLLKAFAGVDGKKSFVLVGENMPQYPGLGMYQFVNDIFSRYMNTSSMVIPQMVASQRSLTLTQQKLGRAANENEVAIHTIYSGESDTETPVESEQSAGEAALARQMDFTNSGSSFASLSRQTGGVALIGSRNFEAAMNVIANDMSNYYALGYRVAAGESGEGHIVVRMKDRTLKVRARQAAFAKSLDQQLEDHVASRLIAADVTDNDSVQIAVASTRKEGRNRMRVTVDIRFPSSLLTLISQDGKKVGGFDIALAASDDTDRLSEVARKREQVSWSEAAVPAVISYKLDVLVRNRAGMISVGVVDALSKQIFYRRVNLHGSTPLKSN